MIQYNLSLFPFFSVHRSPNSVIKKISLGKKHDSTIRQSLSVSSSVNALIMMPSTKQQAMAYYFATFTLLVISRGKSAAHAPLVLRDVTGSM